MQRSCEIFTVNNIHFIRIPKLQNAGLNHLFTSIDMDMRVTDDPKSDQLVAKNLEEIYKVLDIYPKQFYFMGQEHTDWVSIVDQPELGRRYSFGHRAMGVDGLITSQRNFVLGSTEADCVPVLLYDPVKQVQANIHSGWKGTLAKIVERAIKNLNMAYQSDPKDILAGIGPHISCASYEVQYDVADFFYGAFSNYKEIIFQDSDGRITLDLEKAVESTLLGAGILSDHIFSTDLDTYAEPDLLHSFRRDLDNSGLSLSVSTLMQPGEYFVPEIEEEE